MTITAYEFGKVRLQAVIGSIDYHLTYLQRLICSSDLNIWLSCLLSNQRFLVSNPLYKTSLTTQDSSGLHYQTLRSKEDMANHFGTALFARLCLWGYNVYVGLDDAYMPSQYQKTVDKNLSKTGTLGLTNDKNFPPIKDVQKMLKKAITSLPPLKFALFQSILMDMWALQSFAEPIRYEDRRARKSTHAIEEGNEASSDEDNERKKQVKSDFKVFSKVTVKTPIASLHNTPNSSNNSAAKILSSSSSTSMSSTTISSSSSSSSVPRISSSASNKTSSKTPTAPVLLEITSVQSAKKEKTVTESPTKKSPKKSLPSKDKVVLQQTRKRGNTTKNDDTNDVFKRKK